MLSNDKIWVKFLHKKKKEVNPLETNINPELFSSEGFFWVLSASSTGFAIEEKNNYLQIEDKNFKGKLDWATKTLKNSMANGQVDEEASKEAQEMTIENIGLLKNFVDKECQGTDEKKVTALAKSMATYWLTTKLMELEFQSVLSEEEKKNTYTFLDAVIYDHQELEAIEKRIEASQELTEDQKLYLESSWQRGQYFWPKMHDEIQLLADKKIIFKR